MDPSFRRRSPVLRDYQARTLAGLLRGIARYRSTTLTVMYPRQAGKNEVAAHLIAALLRMHAARGGSVVVCAPTLRPQARISIDRLRRILDDTAHLFPVAGLPRWSANTVRVGRASATFLSASPHANVAGHTASIALIADEAQDIEPDWFDRQFRPMAASTGAPAVLFGTPWDGRSLLDRAVQMNRCHDAALADGTAVPLHYEVSWRQVAASRPSYGAHVRRERARLGANHPLFLTQYELRSVADARRLLTPAQLIRLEGRHGRLTGPLPGERYVAGLDLAGDGPHGDASVLTIARVGGGGCCEVVQHAAWRGQPYDNVIAAVVALGRRWGLERLAVDATGLGGPLAVRLADELGRIVEPFTFTAASKSELGFALQAAAETGRLFLYADDGSSDARAVRAELAACGATLAMGRRLEWGNPAGHDDYVASLALCLHAARSLGSPRVAVGRGR